MAYMGNATMRYIDKGEVVLNMAKPIENTERVAVFLPKEQFVLLKEKAKSKGMTASGLIRMLILEFLSN
jgi:hypothetical protein